MTNQTVRQDCSVAERFDLTYLSLGAGVQSSALLVMACKGLFGCPKPDLAVFADTGSERAATYRQVEALRAFAERFGVPVETVTAGSLERQLLGLESKRASGFKVSIPSFAGTDPKGGLLRRQCTREYKLDPIRKHIRQRLGLEPGQRAAGKFRVRCLLGISLDEAQRMKTNEDVWVENCYPLIDARLRREDCLGILAEHGIPIPVKSACVFCPYHDNREWVRIRREAPEEFQRAVEVDRAIRDMTKAGVTHPAFLHRSRVPLEEVDFDALIAEDEAKAKAQARIKWDSFDGECEGMCGV